MKLRRVKGKLILAMTGMASALGVDVFAQSSNQGLPPASNTSRSYEDASVARDSGINRPFDLLNDFYPAITVTISDHDNVRRRPNFDEPDLVVVAKPTLAYRTNFGRHQFYAAYNGSYSFHQDLTQENSESNGINAKLGLDLTRRWDVDVFAGFGESAIERGISGSREFNQFAGNGINSGPENVEYITYGADVTFGRKIGVLTAVLGYEFTDSGFKGGDLFNGASSSDRDRETESVHFDLNWQFASQTSVFGRVQRTNTDYIIGQALNLDSGQTDYLFGLRFKPANALSGVVSFGRSDRDFDDSRRGGYDGGTYYLSLNYAINSRSVIGLNASRFVEEPGDENSSYYESELFGLSWDHSLTSKLSFDAYAKWVDDDYDIGREDSFVDWGIGVGYAWKGWLSAGIYYGEIERDSSINNIDYDDRYFGIRLSSDLRSLLEGRGETRRIEPASFNKSSKTGTTQ